MSRRNLMCLRVGKIDVLFNPEGCWIEFHSATNRLCNSTCLKKIEGFLALQVMAALWVAHHRQRSREFLTLLFKRPPSEAPYWESEMSAYYRCGKLMLRYYS